jgi:hypothetical protein
LYQIRDIGQKEKAQTAAMNTDSMTTMSRSAAISGRGTGFAVHENVWTRELTDDGRVYYYNRATGSSQWHLPNDMYQGSTASKSESSQQGPPATVVWPTHAKATLWVDCVTEVLPEQMLDAGGPPVGGTSATNAVAGIKADPRNIQKICSYIPVFLGEYLRSEAFELTCVRMFKALVVQGNLPLPDNYDGVCDIVLSVETEPSLQLSPDRFARLITTFGPSGNGRVDTQDFVEFMRFTVAIRYLDGQV